MNQFYISGTQQTRSFEVPTLQPGVGSIAGVTDRIPYRGMDRLPGGLDYMRRDPGVSMESFSRERHPTDDIIDTHSRFQLELAPKTVDISSIHGSEG